jgi:hypothetical protein
MKSSFIFISLCATAIFGAQLRPNDVVIPLRGGAQLLVPVAGSTPGANGTFFRSDITIMNLANHDETVVLEWLPQAGGNATTATITIPKGKGIRSPDFVVEYLHQTGLGAIMITGVTSEGVDVEAALYVSSRIWSPQPGTSGTTSQSLPAVTRGSAFFSGVTARLFGVGTVEFTSNYRVNVGIVNADPINTHTFDISASLNLRPFGGPSHFLVTLPPRSMSQVPLGALVPNSEVLIENTTATLSPFTAWIAYGSTIDNITGDAWSELAVPFP